MGKINARGSYGLQLLNMLTDLFANESITIPQGFVAQANAVEKELQNDTSGLVNSLLDFAISAGLVDFSIETSNENLSKRLNQWLRTLNLQLIGRAPIGVENLAKEYYRERWKKSSLLLLRTLWEDVDGFSLPTKLWFVNGRDVKIEDDPKSREIGKENYSLRISKDKVIKIPVNKNEKIFIQKPYEDWGVTEPTPFLIRRGILYNMKFMSLMNSKGASIVSRALEYLLLMKKGDPELVKASADRPELIYSDEDLTNIKNKFETMIADMKVDKGTPTHVTNFDTEFQHLIPNYESALKSTLTSPIERRILAGLGFIEVLEGITSTRKDAIINPRVFISEIRAGVRDYASMLRDILLTVIDENKAKHKKLMNLDYIQVRHSPVKQFLSADAKVFLRSIYDRGKLSSRTLVEFGLDIDFDSEVERKKAEDKKGYNNPDSPLYPPVIQNSGGSDEENDNIEDIDPDQEVLDDRKPNTPEAKNFKNASKHLKKKKKKRKLYSGQTSVETREITLQETNGHTHIARIRIFTNEQDEIVKVVGATVRDTENKIDHNHAINKLEQSELSNDHTHKFSVEEGETQKYMSMEELPDEVKNAFDEDSQKLYLAITNKLIERLGETQATEIAKYVLDKISYKRNDKYILKKQYANLINEKDPLDALLSIKKLEVLMKQDNLLDKINQGSS